MPPTPRRYPAALRELARSANVDHRTARRWALGDAVLPAIARALETAAKAIGTTRAAYQVELGRSEA